jgi:hypothetical protein
LPAGFYATVVRPLLEEQFSPVPYAAALLGPGSEEVAGFDSQRSTGHDWGPRTDAAGDLRFLRACAVAGLH